MSRRVNTPAHSDLMEGTNRREVLLGAGGLAAVAAMGGSAARRGDFPQVMWVGMIEGIGTFEVLSFSWGSSNIHSRSVGAGGGSGKVDIQDLSLTKSTDSTSPKLFLATATGRHFTRATLTMTGRRLTMAYEMHDVIVSSFIIGGRSGPDSPIETVTLNFGSVVLTVNDVSAGWDVVHSGPI